MFFLAQWEFILNAFFHGKNKELIQLLYQLIFLNPLQNSNEVIVAIMEGSIAPSEEEIKKITKRKKGKIEVQYEAWFLLLDKMESIIDRYIFVNR